MSKNPTNRNHQKRSRRTRRDEIFDYICDYAIIHDGPTPTIREIAFEFKLNYKTVYDHIQLLIGEGRVNYRNGKIMVTGSQWIGPDDEE